MSSRRRIPLGRTIWQPVLRTLVRLVMRITVRNAGRVPRAGAGIIYYTHLHWLDPPLIVATSRRYAVPLTKIEASAWPFVGWLLERYHVIFITRGAVDRAALKATWDLLDDGQVAVISPEGTRSLDGRLQAAKEGLAFIARHNPDCWLIPCAVTGTPAFNFKRLWRRPRIDLTYGRPFRFCWPAERATREQQRAMTDEAMTQFLPLLPPSMHGDYAARDPSAVQWLEFLP